MRRYVLGFVFDLGYRSVLLVWRTRRDWQYGKLNGLGGKIAGGETPVHAMVREFREETGGGVADPPFVPYGRLRGDGWEVWLFYARYPGELPPGLQGLDVVEGYLSLVLLADLPNQLVVPNARWLVPMALNHARGLDAAKFFEVVEAEESPPEISLEAS
jgi:8-oxo-dGTP diphosphatase